MAKRPLNLDGMPICRSTDNGTSVLFRFTDSLRRHHDFKVHPDAIQEMTIKLAAAAEQAAKDRGELITPDGRPIVRALIPEKYGIRLSEDEENIFVTFFPLGMHPLDFVLSPSDADKLAAGLAGAAAIAQRKQGQQSH